MKECPEEAGQPRPVMPVNLKDFMLLCKLATQVQDVTYQPNSLLAAHCKTESLASFLGKL
eukprot:1157217-Pelagomonas_calceolata.AAC.7